MVNRFSFNSKILKLFLFFSFIFNVLASNGYSYVIFTHIADQLCNTTAIFEVEKGNMVVAKVVDQNIKDMFGITKNMLNLVGLVDNLFHTDDYVLANNGNQDQLRQDIVKNLVFDMITCLYIFSFEEFVVDLKITYDAKLLSYKFVNCSGLKITNKFKGKNDIYDTIKDSFVIQNLENHAKVFLNNIINRFFISFYIFRLRYKS